MSDAAVTLLIKASERAKERMRWLVQTFNEMFHEVAYRQRAARCGERVCESEHDIPEWHREILVAFGVTAHEIGLRFKCPTCGATT